MSKKSKWEDLEMQVGTPSMVLMPARNYAFKVSDETYVITIPRKGEYHEIEPELFDKKDGVFDLYNSRKRIMYLPALSKVLFAAKKYPSLNISLKPSNWKNTNPIPKASVKTKNNVVNCKLSFLIKRFANKKVMLLNTINKVLV